MSAPRTIQRGSRGAEVERLQRLLGETQDGIFGAITEAAVKTWQRARGLVADGVVGPKTWAAIDAAGLVASGIGVVAPSDIAPVRMRSGVPPEAVELSEAFEGFSAIPYRDSGGVWTIGIGSTRDAAGKPVTARTPPVSRAQAEEMAARDLAGAADLLARDFPAGLPPRWWAVGVLLNNNLGRMTTWGPTLWTLLRRDHWREAAQQMSAYRNDNGVPVLGLRRRRWAEAAYALGMPAELARKRAWTEITTPDGWPKLP